MPVETLTKVLATCGQFHYISSLSGEVCSTAADRYDFHYQQHYDWVGRPATYSTKLEALNPSPRSSLCHQLTTAATACAILYAPKSVEPAQVWEDDVSVCPFISSTPAIVCDKEEKLKCLCCVFSFLYTIVAATTLNNTRERGGMWWAAYITIVVVIVLGVMKMEWGEKSSFTTHSPIYHLTVLCTHIGRQAYCQQLLVDNNNAHTRNISQNTRRLNGTRYLSLLLSFSGGWNVQARYRKTQFSIFSNVSYQVNSTKIGAIESTWLLQVLGKEIRWIQRIQQHFHCNLTILSRLSNALVEHEKQKKTNLVLSPRQSEKP